MMKEDSEEDSGSDYTEDSSVLASRIPRLNMSTDSPSGTGKVATAPLAADDVDSGQKMRADARRSRARLLEAATAAFAVNGADAPLDDIARRGRVGVGTLYRHFPTRRSEERRVGKECR